MALPILAAAIAVTGLVSDPTPVAAANVKVVVVVGPVGSATSSYIRSAKQYARQARKWGASVTEIYSPNATWSRVKAAAAGANILIYLGHGNGHPSPYGAFYADRKDGLGLNRSAHNGNSNKRYYGETYVKKLALADDAVVILNRLCYASGNSEWGAANPSKTTAKKRADNYGAGFLKGPADAVFANGIESISPILKSLLKSNRSVAEIFRADPAWTGKRDFRFASDRTSGATVWMDPYAKHRYYHSVVGDLGLTAAQVRAGD